MNDNVTAVGMRPVTDRRSHTVAPPQAYH